jgi:hypothetical protein
MTARSFNDDQLAGATRCGSWESASTPEILMLRRSKTGARLTDLERIYSVYNFILFYTPIPKPPHWFGTAFGKHYPALSMLTVPPSVMIIPLANLNLYATQPRLTSTDHMRAKPRIEMKSYQCLRASIRAARVHGCANGHSLRCLISRTSLYYKWPCFSVWGTCRESFVLNASTPLPRWRGPCRGHHTTSGSISLDLLTVRS